MAKADDELITSARGRWISLATHIEQQLDPTHDPASVTRRVCRDLDEERLPFRYQDAYGRAGTTLPADYGWCNAEISGSSVTLRLVVPEVPDPPPGLSRELMQRQPELELLVRHNYNPLFRIDAVEVWVVDEPIAKPQDEVAASSPPNDAFSEDTTSNAAHTSSSAAETTEEPRAKKYDTGADWIASVVANEKEALSGMQGIGAAAESLARRSGTDPACPRQLTRKETSSA